MDKLFWIYCTDMKRIGVFLGSISVAHIRFLLSFGFLALAVYSFLQTSAHIPLKAIAFTAVGIGYFAYGVYTLKKRSKGARFPDDK